MAMIGDNEKYGLVALDGISIESALPESAELSKGLYFSRRSPLIPEPHWQEWVGTHFTERLDSGDLSLISKGPSASAGVLDIESLWHSERAFYFYFGLLVSGLTSASRKPLQVMGANEDGGVRIRSITDLDQPTMVEGAPLAQVGMEQLERAAAHADALQIIYSEAQYSRLKRLLQAYLVGATENFLDNRIHQFMRCVEGFILPNQGETTKQMGTRTVPFFTSDQRQLIKELYQIRSNVVHLHDPFKSIKSVDGATPREKDVNLHRYSFLAHSIARFLVDSLLADQKLWRHFVDDNALQKFWEHQLYTEWQSKLDVGDLRKQFNEHLVRCDIGEDG